MKASRIKATVLDAEGKELDVKVLYFPLFGQYWNLKARTWGFNLFKISPEGLVTASRPGKYSVAVRVPKDAEATSRDRDVEAFVQQEIPLTILHPPVKSVEIVDPPQRFYQGTTLRLESRVIDTGGAIRPDVPVRFTGSSPKVVSVHSLGHIKLLSTGRAEITAQAESVTTNLPITVVENPTARLTLQASQTKARTGDVIHVEAKPVDSEGQVITDMPVTYSFHAMTDDLASGGPSSGLIDQDGRFVADLPGEYTIVANSGSHADSVVVAVRPRDVRREIELVGHGKVRNRATSDLWVWEGTDGRDYAITGTHSAGGHAYIWDVTDPGDIIHIDIVRVDARTVNDVKVSEDGRLAVISREGASNRRNGIVILDVSDPQNGARILSSFDDELTGGVHNVYIFDNHVYALSGGRRYDIINIEDPRNPHRVGRFQLENPDRSIHDVVVKDGVAYSANWTDGVVVVDVGGGGRGGSPRNPVKMGSFRFPTGWNHAVYPYQSQSTGKFYIFAGDEAARSGLQFSPKPERGTGTPGYEGEPLRWRGWIHILEWNEGHDPKLVARYEVPEAGSHNIWVEDDIMYVAFYNGGLRVVDVSGELRGNLYRQGREIARFLPFDPEGFFKNAPQVWGAQPHKGVTFFTDYGSGLWAVRLKEEEAEEKKEATDN